MSSQSSDKLKTILAAAKERSLAAQAAAAAPPNAETHRVDALLDRTESLPDPRALSRLYRDKELVDRLPDDEEQAIGPSTSTPPTDSRAPAVYSPPVATAISGGTEAATQPRRPPLSPTQIREVMQELQEHFSSGTYRTFEAKPLPDDVIPMTDDPEEETVAVPEEPREIFYILGAVLALGIIAVFVILALNGPLRYRAPAGGATPSPSAPSIR
ncbi:MAG: hypothetical protein ACR2MY_11760 [Candidatus Dormibacteria bacterium]